MLTRNLIVASNKLNCKLVPKIKTNYKLKKDLSIILYPEGLVTLNASACEVLSMCDGIKSINDIKDIIYTKYKIIDEAQLSDQVEHLLEIAYFNNWIAIN